MSKTADANTDLHYHKQPHTLDPNQPDLKDLDDVPRAQGHTEGDASDVAEADAQHTKQVKDEQGKPEVGARAPGDHAEKSTKKKSD